MLVLEILSGCKQPARQFGNWSFPWSKSTQEKTTTSKPSSNARDPHQERQTPVINNFNVRILESTGTQQCLQNTWSYLDESSPVSKDWQMLQRNGLRCGIGQFSDWPTFKVQLDKCGMKVRNDIQVALGPFNPITLLSDKYRSERTLFYLDQNGKIHGRDFGPSVLEFTLMTAGRVPEGRVRMIFSPKIVKPSSSLDRFGAAKTSTEEELENFNVMVDVGPREFALIGPSNKEMARTLVGPQLFLQWSKGQKKSLFVLISPLEFEKNVAP